MINLLESFYKGFLKCIEVEITFNSIKKFFLTRVAEQSVCYVDRNAIQM